MSDIGAIVGRTSIGLSPAGAGASGHSGGDLFGKMLGNAMEQLGGLQQNADSLAARLAAGENVDLHDVVIAQEQSNLAFQFTMQVRNRAVEAYQEVMRMQV